MDSCKLTRLTTAHSNTSTEMTTSQKTIVFALLLTPPGLSHESALNVVRDAAPLRTGQLCRRG